MKMSRLNGKKGNNKSIKEAVIAVTYNCNSRCRMCNIWQKKEVSQEFKPEDLKNLPSSIKDINLTGGEPFLRSDLPEIIKALRKSCPRAKIIISSNGFATDLIIKQIKEIIKFFSGLGVAISVDGIGQIHDEIRGIPGGFDKVKKTLLQLKEAGIKNLKIGYTVGDYNIHELKKAYRLSRDLGVEMSLAAVHSAENYFGKENVIKYKDKISREIDWLMKEELKTWKPKNWARAYFAHGLIEFLRTGKRILSDYSGKLNIFIDPKGDIYPCDVSSEKLGSIIIEGGVCQPRTQERTQSWMICTARQAIKKHWIRVGWWIVKNKIILSFRRNKNN